MDSVKFFFVPATVRSNLDWLIKGISHRGFIQIVSFSKIWKPLR